MKQRGKTKSTCGNCIKFPSWSAIGRGSAIAGARDVLFAWQAQEFRGISVGVLSSLEDQQPKVFHMWTWGRAVLAAGALKVQSAPPVGDSRGGRQKAALGKVRWTYFMGANITYISVRQITTPYSKSGSERQSCRHSLNSSSKQTRTALGACLSRKCPWCTGSGEAWLRGCRRTVRGRIDAGGG